MKRPNIFLMMTEDICPNLGCYGDTNAYTPRLDEFAKENIRFTYCSSAAPVCSAARTSLNLGMFACTAGVGQHRSCSPLPDYIKNIGEYMQEAGYFTAIGKTDFNFPHDGHKGYDTLVHTSYRDDDIFGKSYVEVLEKAGDKPVFVVQTTAITHQSQYGYTDSTEKHRQSMPRLLENEKQNRDDIDVPNYHFNTLDARELWAQYHEKITTMDRMIGEAIDNLKKVGKYEDSIIFFVGDNGQGFAQGKCELWDEGVHVPFIMHVPKEMEAQFDLKEDEYGRYCERLTSFTDFGATALSLAGAEIPSHFQGRVLLGDNKTEDPTSIYSYSERVDEVFENSRCIREKDKLFTCDFAYSPFRRLNSYQHLSSPWFTRSMIEKCYENDIPDTDRRAFFRSMPRVAEQMFDLVNDKDQFDNLCVKPEYADELVRMRELLLADVKKYRDGVFMPEPLYFEYMEKTGKPIYEVFQDDEQYPLDRLINLWRCCVTGKQLPDVISGTACERMMLAKFCADKNELDKIKALQNDESEVIRAYVAYRLDDNKTIEDILSTTKNHILIMYIADLIAFWWDGKGNKSLEIMIERCIKNKEFDVSERYLSPIGVAIDMLTARFNYNVSNDMKTWDEAHENLAKMVLSAVKK